MSLGDIPAINLPEETSNSMFSMDYYRNKALEFQVVLNALDSSYLAAINALNSGALDDNTAYELQDLVSDYESRRTTLRLTAEGFNAGASMVNAAGGRFPVLSLPQTLGLAPFIVPAAVAGAVIAAAGLVVWGNSWIVGVNDRLKRAQILDSATPEQREQLLVAMQEADNAVATASASALSQIAPILKWGAVGLMGWFLYRAYQSSNKRNS